MADDNVDFRFLGRQVQILQGDVRDLRAAQLRTDSEVAGIKADMARLQAEMNVRFERLEQSIDSRFDAVLKTMDARFEQAHQTMATNLEVVLAAIAGLTEKIENRKS